jgi:hypothetical protein
VCWRHIRLRFQSVTADPTRAGAGPNRPVATGANVVVVRALWVALCEFRVERASSLAPYHGEIPNKRGRLFYGAESDQVSVTGSAGAVTKSLELA